MAVPYIFANRSGSVPASELDADFAYILANTVQTSSPNAFSALQRMVGHCFDFGKSADLASAAALNLNDPQAPANPGTVTGNYVVVTGTNTVTSVTLSSGASRVIRAGGAFTWQNGASLVVQGGANYTAAAGDFFIVQGDASSVVYVLVFPASGFIAGSTGTGAVVRANSPALVTPALGTPASGTLTNCTGLPVSTGVAGLGANVATFLATPSSANLRAALTDETGTGAAVFADSPTLVTPVLGVASATSVTDAVGRLQALPRTTTAALNAIGNAINTANKFTDKAVINTSTGTIVTAAGATAGSVWLNLDGTTANTPV